MTIENIFYEHAEALRADFMVRAASIADATGLSQNDAADSLRKHLRVVLSVNEKGEEDGRALRWRVRVRLYDDKDEIRADSDPELPPDAAGTVVVLGLPAVGNELVELAELYHGVQCVGLDTTTLKHKIKSLRPTLSRRGGNAAWRVSYLTQEGNRTREWVARVDIARVETSESEEQASKEQTGSGSPDRGAS